MKMIDNVTNNPRKREPLCAQWWVPSREEMLKKGDTEYLVPVRKLNAVQKDMFKKIVEEDYSTGKSILTSAPYLCKDLLFIGGSHIALIKEPIFTGRKCQCWAEIFIKWMAYPKNTALSNKFLTRIVKGVAYENPFYQETKE